MSYTLKTLDKSQLEITVTVLPDEYRKYLKAAAERLAKRSAIKGFRPGKAPFEIIERQLGAMNILREALETIVQKTFYEAVKAEQLETIGMPKVDISKLAPGNEVVYTATVALLPTVTVANIKDIKAERRVQPIEEKKIDQTITALRGLQASEALKSGRAEAEDKVVIDMNMFLDKVPVDGGFAKDYQVYLGEEHYIPGFNAALLGASAGDELNFNLSFPENHYQKMLAGKKVDFSVKVKGVYRRQLPDLDDEFAKKLGQSSVSELLELIANNLRQEEAQKAEERVEIELLDSLVAGSKFSALPEVLIEAEKQKIFLELKRDLERNSISIEKYLADIKKTEKEIFADFQEQAEKRAKSALVLRQLAKENGLNVSEEEITNEINSLKAAYKDDQTALGNLARPEVRDTIANMLQHRKAIGWLKNKILSTATAADNETKKQDEKTAGKN